MKLFSKIAIKNDSIKFKALFSLLGIKLIRLIFEKVFFGMYYRFSLFFCLYIQNGLNLFLLTAKYICWRKEKQYSFFASFISMVRGLLLPLPIKPTIKRFLRFFCYYFVTRY